MAQESIDYFIQMAKDYAKADIGNVIDGAKDKAGIFLIGRIMLLTYEYHYVVWKAFLWAIPLAWYYLLEAVYKVFVEEGKGCYDSSQTFEVVLG